MRGTTTHLRTRRRRTVRFLGLASAAVVGAGLPVSAGSTTAQPAPCEKSPVPAFFKDEVRQAPEAVPDSPGHYTVVAHKARHSFHSDWPPVPTLAYSAPGAPMSYLGPTLVTKRGQPVDVSVVNKLPDAGTPVFPFDQPDNNNKITTHRHAGLQTPESDGLPEPLQPETPPGGTGNYHFPNNQPAAPLWYHDHAHHSTSYHIYEGLAGFMPNTDPAESRLPLPKGEFAKRFLIQDKKFNADGSLCYNHLNTGFAGDLPVINGTVAPKQPVEPRRYTFTLLNASDSRFYRVGLGQPGGKSAQRPAMTVVGTDFGYLKNPVPVDELLLAPAERYTVVVDFTGHEGQNWVLTNSAAARFGAIHDIDAGGGGIPQLMRFDVGTSTSSPDRSQVPSALMNTETVPSAEDLLSEARLRTVQSAHNASGEPQLGDRDQLLNYHDGTTETPQTGSTEVWALRNRSPIAHAIHLHMAGFRVIGRWRVGQWDANGKPVPGTIGPFEPPLPHEAGPKETFVAPPNYITAWAGRYTQPGTTVWHCHMLIHEDGSSGHAEMMRPLTVGDTVQSQLPEVHNRGRLDELIREP